MNDEFIKQYLNELTGKGFFESIGNGISIQDTNYKILYQNRNHKSLIGEHIGKYCYQAYEKRESECENCPLTVTFKDGLPHTSERSVPTGRGTLYVEITSSSIRDNSGKIIAGIEVVRDITSRKRAEESLKESEEKYRLLFSAEKDAIIMVDSETTKIIDANDSALHLYGYSKEELLKLTGPDLSAEPEKSTAAIKDIALKTDNYIHYHARNHKTKDGTVFPVEISSGSFFLKDKKIVSALIRDITERKQFENERELFLREVEDKNKELEQLLYASSHDLRTPLVNIGGYTKEIIKSIEEVVSILQNEGDLTIAKEKITLILESDIAESENYISKNIKKMDALLSGLLNLSRLGRQKLTKEKLNINKIMSDIADSMTYQVNDIGAKLNLSELPYCTGDAMQINQLFSNLIENALKYLDSERSGAINVSGRKEKGYSVYCVEDNGIGISPKYQEKIFNIFYQLEPSKEEGEGIGLAIASRIAQSHSGKIWVESEIGKGSKFIVALPA